MFGYGCIFFLRVWVYVYEARTSLTGDDVGMKDIVSVRIRGATTQKNLLQHET